jgi:hypothetical protein
MPARRLWAIEYVIHGEKRRETCFDVEGFEVVRDYEQNRPLTCSVLRPELTHRASSVFS